MTTPPPKKTQKQTPPPKENEIKKTPKEKNKRKKTTKTKQNPTTTVCKTDILITAILYIHC